ncbi:DUF2855 family protein [Sphingomonas sp. SUN039]|uniref:DUF2855 family protein n=1 Tax=Sphingomonas sp. SUN039 TaxID=2937787 RepID=UPI00216416FE|nr:DUF2855 family protein [Sphingomonas sp. SUN039]UVO52951.1 DUF2855 family protein [Sphingomonas sp. SUN039]
MPQQITVPRTAFAEATLDALALSPLDAGQALLKIDQFAVTSNNVTYAAIGEAFGYWDFFPAGERRGIVPVWGHATVVDAGDTGLTVGERVYGYLPMATHLVVEPVAVTGGSFTDGAAHRQKRAAVYNQYRRLDADPGHVAGGEDVRSVFEPLFLTSFLIEAMFRREAWHGAERLIVTSASSKTAMALAHVARASSPQVERIGLTSARNIGFVERTGLYDKVLGYDEMAEIGGGSAVSVDFAGNGATLSALHEAVGDDLKYSCLVGATDWANRGGFGARDIAGPKPVLFFAPDHVATTVAELGPKGFGAAVADRWRAFAGDAAKLVKIEAVAGLADAIPAWRAAVDGRASPDVGVVVRP